MYKFIVCMKTIQYCRIISARIEFIYLNIHIYQYVILNTDFSISAM